MKEEWRGKGDRRDGEGNERKRRKWRITEKKGINDDEKEWKRMKGERKKEDNEDG